MFYELRGIVNISAGRSKKQHTINIKTELTTSLANEYVAVDMRKARGERGTPLT